MTISKALEIITDYLLFRDVEKEEVASSSNVWLMLYVMVIQFAPLSEGPGSIAMDIHPVLQCQTEQLRRT